MEIEKGFTGRKVINGLTGEIKTIKHLHYTDLAEFTDGTKSDIHRMGFPLDQENKKWKWIEVDNSYYEIY